LTLVSIANLLFAFAEFSGIGAKTSVGMGGVQNEQ
jgi:CRISPR/Cas system endoribonuclease Cas6 (RAMP superfamily)